jgi:AcrR family transcriptional regulator
VNDAPLPRGRHRLPPAAAAESQHWRLLTSAAEVLLLRGYRGVTSREICRHAGVSPATFYRHFEHADGCLLAAHAVAADCLWELISAACAEAGSWPERSRAALDAAIDFLVAEPGLSRLLCADLAVGVPAAAAARERLIEQLSGLLCAGRGLQLSTAGPRPPQIETHLAAATVGLLGDRVAAGESATLPILAPELAEILIGPSSLR